MNVKRILKAIAPPLVAFVSGFLLQEINHSDQLNVELTKAQHQFVFSLLKSSRPAQSREIIDIIMHDESTSGMYKRILSLIVRNTNTVHPMTRLAVRSNRGGVRQAELDWNNDHANLFYGFPPGSERLMGAHFEEILKIIEPWMLPADYQAFLVDQVKAINQFEREGFAVAKVPFRFTSSHPNERFRNKAFLPIVSEITETEDDKQGKVLHVYVLYYEIENP